MLETIAQDLRHATRMLAKNPGFAFIAIISIAIGVGANAAMFSIADGLILRPLPVPRPGEIVALPATTPAGEVEVDGVSYPDYVDVRDRARSFDGLTADRGIVASFAGTRGEPALSRFGLAVSGNLFEVFEVRAAIGRTFVASDDRAGADPAIVLSHATWTQLFGSDPGIVGTRIPVGGEELTVIGVAPARFTGLDIYLPPAFYVPLAILPRLDASGRPDLLERRDGRTLRVMGRLQRGVSIGQAREDVRLITAALERSFPATNRNHGLLVQTNLEVRMAEFAPMAALSAMLILLAFAVLIVACANVAGLLTSHAPVRAREIALRLAIGGSRVRVLRQYVAESLLLAAGGGLVGLALGYAAIVSFQRFQVASDVGVRLTYVLDRRALLVAFVVAVASALLSSVVPGWRAARMLDLSATLRNAGGAAPRKSGMWGNGLVAAQVAMTLVLLTVAVSFHRAFEAVYQRGPGFRTEGMLLVSLDPGLARYDDTRTEAFYRLLKDRVQAISGVASTGLSSFVPLSQGAGDAAAIVPDDFELPPGATSITVPAARVDEGYLETIGIEVVRGRGFQASDSAGAPRVAIVNSGMAARYWPGDDPIGKRVRLGDRTGPLVEIVGVTANNHYRLFTPASADFLYLPRAQNPIRRSTLLIASREDAAALAAPVREAVRALDPSMPVLSVRTMEDYYYASAQNFNDVTVQTVAGMGMMGLVLALAGLYGLVAYAAARRTREIGIRMAVGANPSSVLRLVLRHGWLPASCGTVLGVIVSAGAGGLIRNALTGADIDIGTYLLVVPAVFAAVMAAAYIPARRAARLDPLLALRQD